MDDDFLRMRIGSEGDRRRLDAAAGSSRFYLINFEQSGTVWWFRANLASPASRHQHVSDLLECRKDHLLSFVVPFGCELLALAPLFFFRRSLRFAGGVPCYSFLECVFDLRSHVRPSSRKASAHPLAQPAEIFAKCWSEWQDL